MIIPLILDEVHGQHVVFFTGICIMSESYSVSEKPH